MRLTQRSLIRAILAISMIAALPGSLLGGNDLTGHKDLRIASFVFEAGVADGAGIPEKADAKVETSYAIESVFMLILGVSLIVIAVLGKRILQI